MLPEVATDLKLAARRIVDEFANLVIAHPPAFFFLFIFNLRNEVGDDGGVAFLPEKQTFGGKTVASCPACFLIKLFDAFRQCQVNHATHGGFVNTETESHCSDDDANFIS